ncbi:MAG TPA: hypothetical protein VFW14_07845, partial [Gaiellales bacterium]|nr:hypothetical protein [Gaiellales bacterium]
WDTTVNQRDREGILVVYAGGRRGATYPVSRSHGPAPAHVARETVAQLAAIHPHLERDFTGRRTSTPGCTTPGRAAPTPPSRWGQYTRS